MVALPTTSLPLTAFYSGAVGILFALLSFRAFSYRLAKGPKAFFGDKNIPEAPKLQGIVRVNRVACVLSYSCFEHQLQHPWSGLQSQGNLAEFYAAFFLLFAILEFNKNASTALLNFLGLL